MNSEEGRASVIEGTVTCRVRVTFNECVGSYAERVELIIPEEVRNRVYDVRDISVNPNGYSYEYEGYVSILFWTTMGTCPFQRILLVSLVDSSGSKRFPQSYEIPYLSSLFIGNYISRETLMRDPADLLPNNILTLSIYLRFTFYPEDYNSIHIDSEIYFTRDFSEEAVVHKLRLDSPLAERLSKVSGYFRAMLDSAWKEKETKTMPLYEGEIDGFREISYLIMGNSVLTFNDPCYLLQMYAVADKYDIPFAKEISKGFMKLYASKHGVKDFLRGIENFKDEYLKELLEAQIAVVGETNFAEEIAEMDRQEDVSLKQPLCNDIWVYMYSERKFKGIVFRKYTYDREVAVKKYDGTNQESGVYTFYK